MHGCVLGILPNWIGRFIIMCIDFQTKKLRVSVLQNAELGVAFCFQGHVEYMYVVLVHLSMNRGGASVLVWFF